MIATGRSIPASTSTLSGDERAVLDVLAPARGRSAAVSIDVIRQRTGFSYRHITSIIERLIVEHKLPIGSARGKAHGFFLVEDAADLSASTRPLRRQAISMLKRAAALEGPGGRKYLAFAGQLEADLDQPQVEQSPEPLRAARVRGTDAVIFVPPTKARICFHCGGPGECRCVACNEGEESHGRCCACLGVGRLADSDGQRRENFQ